jgi:uncharacterized protein YkwD
MIRQLTALLSLGTVTAFAEEPAKPARVMVEPAPAAMTPVSQPEAPAMAQPRTTLWSIGAPTNEEQYYLELMNRARANPTAEGARLAATTDPEIVQSYTYFGVNLATMQSEMRALPVAPPLAINAKLTQAARDHSNDQFTNAFQGHSGSDGSSIATRLNRVGYSASYYAENVYAYSKNTWFGHAGFEVDWGAGPGGMQPTRGHRAIIHAGFREVGVGIRNGTSSGMGPQVVTQDFGVPAGTATPFVTGVAYYDFDGDNFYDPGEGIGGITVNVSGSSWHAVTPASGGYAIPVPAGAAERTVSFSGPGFNGTAIANLTGTNNVKVDFKPVYAAPTLSGPAIVSGGTPSSYQLSVTGGATSYEWRSMVSSPAAFDAVTNLSRVNVTPYAWVLSGAYQMTQPQGQTQTVTYKNALRGGSAPSLQFQSRLAAATTAQRALVQVSTDNGLSWTTLDTQSGTNSNGQTAFTPRTLSLATVAGRDFLLRFAFGLAGTTYYTGTGATFGWHVDSVAFTDVLDTSGAVITPISGGGRSFTFTPPASTGTWLFSGRAVISGRTLEFGPSLTITAQPPGGKFNTWAATFESSAGLPSGTLSNAPAADYNRDGIANLMAYALDVSPVSPGAAGLPRAVVTGGHLRLDYTRRTDRTDVVLVPQVSSDLTNWFTPGQSGAPAGFTDSSVSLSGTAETRRATVPLSGTHRYLRLKATRL